ncbi:hypothetical protein FRC06_000346 [Ceratobasidium sp. 370]|nr:hypothetical protein FRC06_000346 [Ceratobasidium sp. 370]
MTLNHEDRSDLDSLFGDDELDELENDEHDFQPPRSVISFPRAAVVSQNVGTIAPFSVPSSSEHHSSGYISSASIPLTRNSVEPHPRSEARGKRNASPRADQPSKKRRVESDDSSSSAKTRVAKQLAGEPTDLRPAVLQKRTLTFGSDAFGLPTPADRARPADALQAALNLLAPRTTSAQSRPRALNGKTLPSTAAISGTGSATDPVVIPDDNAASMPVSQTPSAKNPAQSLASRRLTRSQEAHALLESLPTDPTDILSQTLRTILKTPTTISHSRNSTPRDIAVYLANGRYTGTPFLRLLRHLAGPTRLKDTKTGLELLKKLVETMRMTGEASKPVMASQSSAASTPMPVTPGMPSAVSFPAAETAIVPYSPGSGLESDLFAHPEFSLDASVCAPADLNKAPQPLSDIVIDPQLLALSQGSNHLQVAPSDAQNFDFNFEELLGALPLPPFPVPGIDPPTNPTEYSAETMDFPGWDELSNIPLDLDTWCPMPTASTPAVPYTQPAVTPLQSTVPSQRPFTYATQITQRVSKQSDLPPGGIRIPSRTEALALMERARARKAEIEAKIKSARRQTWGCMVEAAVQRNLLGRLRGGGFGDEAVDD